MSKAQQKDVQLRTELLGSIKRYEDFLQKELDVYRDQRAWKLMLLFRKYYTLLFREAPKKPLTAFKKIFTEPIAKHDLQFPCVWDFLPADALAALQDRPAGTAGPARNPAFESTAQFALHSLSEPSGGVARYSLIVLPIFDFELRFQRPQQIAARFAANGHTVYWISPSRRPSRRVAGSYEIVPIRRNLLEVRMNSLDYELHTGEMTPEILDSLAVSIEEMVLNEGLAETWTLIQFPFWRKLGLRLREKFGYPMLYDCMDSFQDWPVEPKPSAANCADERCLFAEADVVTVTAEGLGRRAKQCGAKPVLAPNAADTKFFELALPNGEISHLKPPVIGYFGVVADWFDLGAVAHMAASRPEYNFVIIGEVVPSVDAGPLKRLPNVHLLGEKKYALLPSFLKRFDVCLLPNHLGPLMEYANHVKLYEYFSQGKPVVSSRLTQLHAPHELVYFADDHDSYVRQLDAALAESDPALAARRIEFARVNNWNSRVMLMEKAMRARTPLVSIVVLTHNSEAFLPEFQRYLLKNTAWQNWELIYADNCSTDSTQNLISGFASEDSRIRMILFDENLGFAGGNNAAARLASGDYLVFLNPDTVVTRGWLGRLLAPLVNDPKVGMTAPVTNHSGNQTRIDAVYSGVTEMEQFAAYIARTQSGKTLDVPMAPLLCAALRRQTWEEVGDLDDRFRVGMFEDDDYGLRLGHAGLKTVTAEDCFIHHFGNGSFRQLDPDRSNEIFQANLAAFEQKWGIKWHPHQMRPGVPPLETARLYSPSWFFVL
ncbi:MAG TPA: glycosyltransferase [Bryobacteraceae bacterium]|nr:glycosyltransferase [Bryobacteraceae bacterium]